MLPIRAIPPSLRAVLRPPLALLRAARGLVRGLAVLLAGPLPRGEIRVSYGHPRLPGPSDREHGGIIKVQRMQDLFPNAPTRFNVLYLVSSRLPDDAVPFAWFARRKGARLVWNQDGVAYPAWHGPGWERTNAPMRRLLHQADYVFYQSQFCKQSADRFLGPPQAAWEVLYNAVDTSVFTPSEGDSDPTSLVLLLAGTQYHFHRVAAAVQVLAGVVQHGTEARLLLAGQQAWLADEAKARRSVLGLAAELGVADRVQFLGTYRQIEAPSVFRQAHVLVHTKYNDPCPGVVIEALACGLPVVYSHSGGVPELVGPHAGIGIPVEQGYEREVTADPRAMADAVLRIVERRREFAEAARQRAVDRFDLQPWLRRHQEIFQAVLR